MPKKFCNFAVDMREILPEMRRRLRRIFDDREAAAVERIMFEDLKHWQPVDVALNREYDLGDFMRGRFRDVLTRLEHGEPLQYILGHARFYGSEYEVDRHTLIPRPETEELVDMIVSRAGNRPDLRVLDLGTGTGCIAIALARNLRFAQVEAVDISAGALEVARRNAARLKARVVLLMKDMLTFTPQSDCYDIIVSNPPYICESERKDMERRVLDHEPAAALFVPDADPLRFYKAIARISVEALKPGGKLYLEINTLHAQALVDMLCRAGLADVQLHLDIHGKKRFATAVKPAGE